MDYKVSSCMDKTIVTITLNKMTSNVEFTGGGHKGQAQEFIIKLMVHLGQIGY